MPIVVVILICNLITSADAATEITAKQLPKADAYKAVVQINNFILGDDDFLGLNSTGSDVIIDSSGLLVAKYRGPAIYRLCH